ncbi:hypothetical protein MRX96_002967 [Rhipicephalus microplus]
MQHRVPFTRRLTAYDVTERHAAGPRQRRLTLGTAAAAAEPGSVVSSRHLSAAPLSRRLSQAVGRFVKPAPAQDAAMSTAATATVAAEATMEAGKPEGDESFHLQVISTTAALKNEDAGKTSPKPALKDSRRKSMAAKRASLAEPSHLGITSNSDEPPLYPRPQPPSAIKRRQSIAPPRSSTPVTSVSDYSTSHTVPAIKRLRTDKVASVLPQVLADAAASMEASSTPVHRDRLRPLALDSIVKILSTVVVSHSLSVWLDQHIAGPRDCTVLQFGDSDVIEAEKACKRPTVRVLETRVFPSHVVSAPAELSFRLPQY